MALENHSVLQQKTLGEVMQNSSKPGLRNRRGGDSFGGPPNYSLGEDRMDVDEPGMPSSTWGESGKKKKLVLSQVNSTRMIISFPGSDRKTCKRGQGRGIDSETHRYNTLLLAGSFPNVPTLNLVPNSSIGQPSGIVINVP
jgi:hypothetical protein